MRRVILKNMGEDDGDGVTGLVVPDEHEEPVPLLPLDAHHSARWFNPDAWAPSHHGKSYRIREHRCNRQAACEHDLVDVAGVPKHA